MMDKIDLSFNYYWAKRNHDFHMERGMKDAAAGYRITMDRLRAADYGKIKSEEEFNRFIDSIAKGNDAKGEGHASGKEATN